MTNLRLALRTLARTPFVTLVAVLSLALGIGANAAIYSLFDQLLLRPLPVTHPEQLVNLAAPGPNPGSQSCTRAGDCNAVFSYPMFQDLETRHPGLSGIAAFREFYANVAVENAATVDGDGMLVSGSYFPLLGVRPALGRLFTTNDARTVGGDYSVVLSYNYWLTRLGGDRGIVGKVITVNGNKMTVIGVAPKGFEGSTMGTVPIVYAPITMLAQMQPGFNPYEKRRFYWAYLFGRLAPGVSMTQAATAINTVYSPIINDVEAPLQTGMSPQTMVKFRAKKITLADGRRGMSSMFQQTKTPLILLFSITALVLIIACANIANLLLARAAVRSTEMAVRLSLGATRAQLLVQLLTESCLLALLGGVVSLFIAHLTLGLLASLLPADTANALQFELHWGIVWFAALLSIGTGVLFGLYPALQSTRPDLVSTLRSGSGKLAGAGGTARFRTTLVVGQITLSMALLVLAGLFVKSLGNVSRVELGINADNVVTFELSPELDGYKPVRSAQLFDRVQQELAATPGVTAVTASLVPLLTGSNWGSDVSVQGFKKGPDTDANSRFNEVGPGYFKALGMPMLAGREFTPADRVGAPQVAIVNETFAKKFGLGRDAVGKFMGTRGVDSLNIQIVGLVKDAKYSSVKQAIPPLFFQPLAQDSTAGDVHFYVRTAGDPTTVLRAIPKVVASLDHTLPVENLKTLPQQVKENVYLDRMISVLSAAFAVLATLLAAIGLYGVLAYSVAQRTKEIGVRMALGANTGDVQRMVLRQVGLMTVAGCLAGAAIAFGLGKTASSLLYQMTGGDPVTFVAAGVVLAAIAVAAGWAPARRAAKVDPMQALRYE